MMAQFIQLETGGLDDVEIVMARLSRELSNRATIKRAVRFAVRPMIKSAKGHVTQPGYPGDKTQADPLVDQIGIYFDDTEPGVVGVVGPIWPAGAHGWLVEHGHRIVTGGHIAHQKYRKRGVKRRDSYAKSSKQGNVSGMTKPVHYMAKAIMQTQQEVERRFDDKMTELTNKATDG